MTVQKQIEARVNKLTEDMPKGTPSEQNGVSLKAPTLQNYYFILSLQNLLDICMLSNICSVVQNPIRSWDS